MSYNMTFDGVDFHDSTATDAAVHTECVWAGDVQGLTVKNSLFRNCAYFGLFLTHYLGTDPKNVVIENNVFEHTKQWNGQDAPYSMMVAGHITKMDGFTFRNNTFETEVGIEPTNLVNTKMVGNIGVAATLQGRRDVLLQRVVFALVRLDRPRRVERRVRSSRARRRMTSA